MAQKGSPKRLVDVDTKNDRNAREKRDTAAREFRPRSENVG